MDYKGIRFWGHMLGSSNRYIADDVERARREKAPANAIYRGEDGWRTTDTVRTPSVIRRMEHEGFDMSKARALLRDEADTAEAVFRDMLAHNKADASRDDLLRVATAAYAFRLGVDRVTECGPAPDAD